MQAVEALTRLLALADAHQSSDRQDLEAGTSSMDSESRESFEQDEIAISICQAMLNTALLVTRFRCFVRIESGKGKGREYTICGVRIEDIVAGLHPLTSRKTDVYVLLFEQRPTGADALEGYQGTTKSFTRASQSRFENYLEGLRRYAEVVN